MTQEAEINIFRCLDFLRDNASDYATAKANRAYLEEYRKTLKAQLMIESEQAGAKSAATQERDAYAHTNYINHLCALQEAIQIEENLRWKLVAAQAKIEAWRTIESSRRYEAKTL
jgi:hypothetical protein